MTELDGDMPLVVVGGDPAIGAPTVTIDQLEGARMATRHLLDLGHRTVHHVAGPRPGSTPRPACGAGPMPSGRTPRRRGRPVAGDWSARRGYDAGTRLARDADVTAVFAANDQTALGVIRGLHDAGRRVPEDVSVVGFDDTPESGYFLPPLTTVRQDFGEVGRRSVELLLSLADGEPVDRHVIVPAELVVRASTAPPP